MRRRQRVPQRWLIVAAEDDDLIERVRRLPAGSGVLLLLRPTAGKMRRLRQVVRRSGLVLIEEGPRSAARVHCAAELRRAMLRRTPLILLSPLYATLTHPDWRPIPHMRAATLARLAGRRLVALGGMNEKRYAKVAPLGFVGWAGISAWMPSGKKPCAVARESRVRPMVS